MISIRCTSLASWGFTYFLERIYLVLVLNLLLSAIGQIHAASKFGDRYKREATTMLPEIPQGDMDTDITLPPETDPCYRFVNVSSHQFFSPGFQDSETYPNNTDCVVVLKAPSNHLIRLDFRDYFAIEQSPECKNDFLEVRDGPHGYNTLLEPPFCGFKFPPMLTSSDRYLWIHFKSDENIEYKGFKAVFEYVERPSTLQTPEIIPCRMDLANQEQDVFGKANISKHITDFVDKYDMPIDCVWAITVKKYWKIQLQFQKFSLDKPNDCESNFIEVFSDKTNMPSIEQKFCGSIADTVMSKGNVMFVRFFTEERGPKSTFEANFTAFRPNDKESRFYKLNCHDDEFDCEDATCISKTLKCNGVYNCRFRWDEDDCQSSKSLALTDDHIIIIMVIFSLLLTGMCITFVYNCIKKLIRDHHTIQEYIRQSREQQLNELDKQDQADKKVSCKAGSGGRSRSRSHSSPSLDSQRFEAANAVNTPCYVPGGELLPILIRNNEHSMSPSNGDAYNQNIYTVDNENLPEMCDSACQTRESLFTTQAYSSGNSTPNHSIHTNSPPAPFSTFGYKKDNKFKAEAKIEMASTPHPPHNKLKYDDKRRPYSVQTTKSAPDVIVTH